jgi:hypothetical protein
VRRKSGAFGERDLTTMSIPGVGIGRKASKTFFPISLSPLFLLFFVLSHLSFPLSPVLSLSSLPRRPPLSQCDWGFFLFTSFLLLAFGALGSGCDRPLSRRATTQKPPKAKQYSRVSRVVSPRENTISVSCAETQTYPAKRPRFQKRSPKKRACPPKCAPHPACGCAVYPAPSKERHPHS